MELCISDTGNGIPDEIRDRVLEPLFTTEEIGKEAVKGSPFLTASTGTAEN